MDKKHVDFKKEIDVLQHGHFVLQIAKNEQNDLYISKWTDLKI